MAMTNHFSGICMTMKFLLNGIRPLEHVLVNLDPTVGSEIKKTRPCFIISPIEMNTYQQTIVIVPVTSSSNPNPTRVEIKHHKTKGWIVGDQIRAVDRQRIIKIPGPLNAKETLKLKSVIFKTLVE
jgi:mRNA interferase MazF